MKRRMIFLALLFIICSIHVSANGKFFLGLEHVTPGVPYQRALLIFDEGKETLVLQSTFSLEDFSIGGFNLGWVVPVPSIPDLDSLTSEQASELFFALNLRSSRTFRLFAACLELNSLYMSLKQSHYYVRLIRRYSHFLL